MFDKHDTVNTKDFEYHFTYEKGKFNVFAEWICRVLEVFTGPHPSPKLLMLERQYSSVVESDEMRVKYDLDKATCEQLRQLFYAHCSGGGSGSGKTTTQFVSNRADLQLSSWLTWVVDTGYLSPLIAKVMFHAKKAQYRNTWRFVDFAEFCMDHAAGTIEHRVAVVCNAFVMYGNNTTDVFVRKKGEKSRVHLSLRGMIFALA
eukprot:gene31556-38976_t